MQKRLKLFWLIFSPMLMFIGWYAVVAQFHPITWQPLLYGSLSLAAIQLLIYAATHHKRPNILPITMLYFQMVSILSIILIEHLAPSIEAMICIGIVLVPWTIISLFKIFHTPKAIKYLRDKPQY